MLAEDAGRPRRGVCRPVGGKIKRSKAVAGPAGHLRTLSFGFRPQWKPCVRGLAQSMHQPNGSVPLSPRRATPLFAGRPPLRFLEGPAQPTCPGCLSPPVSGGEVGRPGMSRGSRRGRPLPSPGSQDNEAEPRTRSAGWMDDHDMWAGEYAVRGALNRQTSPPPAPGHRPADRSARPGGHRPCPRARAGGPIGNETRPVRSYSGFDALENRVLASAGQTRQAQRSPRGERGCLAAANRPSVENLEDRGTSPAPGPVDTPPSARCAGEVTADFNQERFCSSRGRPQKNASNTLSVHPGQTRTARFQSRPDHRHGTRDSLAVGDFNADGNLDVATGNLPSYIGDGA